jgi:hypothetical protein
MLQVALSKLTEVVVIPCLFAWQCCGLHFEWRLMLVEFVFAVWSIIVLLDVLYVLITRKGTQWSGCACVCCLCGLGTPSLFPVRSWICHEHNRTSIEAWGLPWRVLSSQCVQKRSWQSQGIVVKSWPLQLFFTEVAIETEKWECQDMVKNCHIVFIKISTLKIQVLLLWPNLQQSWMLLCSSRKLLFTYQTTQYNIQEHHSINIAIM